MSVFCSPAISQSCCNMDVSQQSWKKKKSWNHTFIRLFYDRITLQSRLTCTADPRTSPVRVWGSSAFLWMFLSHSSWGCTAIWAMRKIISLHVFLVAFQQWLPTCCLSQLSHWKNHQKGRSLFIHPISVEWPSDVQPLPCSVSLRPMLKSELHYSSLGWKFRFCIYRLDPAPDTLTRNLRVTKSTFILSCLTREHF